MSRHRHAPAGLHGGRASWPQLQHAPSSAWPASSVTWPQRTTLPTTASPASSIADFTAAANRISEVLGYWPLRHIANSPGITRFPGGALRHGAAGRGMHGIGVDAAQTAQLMPAHRLSTPIAQLKDVPAEDSIGYGRSYRATAPCASAPCPSATRTACPAAGQRPWPGVRARPARPFVGSICMDMCMVDVTGIPCEPGDDAVVFDAAHPVQQFAKDLGRSCTRRSRAFRSG